MNSIRGDEQRRASAIVGSGPAAPALGDDLLQGAEEIAEFLFGDRAHARRVFYLSSETRAPDRPPFFKLGGRKICARRSTLLAWIAKREGVAAAPAA